jgi:hypothetical protein
MNYFAALLALACVSAGAAPPQQSAAGGLRQTLQQYHPASGASPRELTPVERAELRRQLSEQPRPQPRRR